MFLLTGMAEKLPEEKNQATRREAEITSKAISNPIPVTEIKHSWQMDDTDIEELRNKFPCLHQLSTTYIRGLSPSEIINFLTLKAIRSAISLSKPCNYSIEKLELPLDSHYCKEVFKASKYAKPYQAPGARKKPTFVDICFHYNRGTCNRQAGACTSKMGTVLRHVCDFKVDKDNPSKRCEGEHQRCVFHK